MKLKFGLTAIAVIVLSPALALAACPAGVTCDEYTGAGKKGSFFRASVPTSPAWDGDLILINHGFDLDPLSIRPHATCTLTAGTPCDTDLDCAPGQSCKKIDYFGIDEVALPLGKAVAASTYSLTGWSVFNSRKDLADILKFFKKEIGLKPTRVIVTGFSMGGAVTVDATLRISSKKIHGAVPICPAAAGGLPSWDSATDLRMIYDMVCDGVDGGEFFGAPDLGITLGQIAMAVRIDTCTGVLAPSADPGEAAAQAQRKADIYALSGFEGTDDEFLVIMGFATLAVNDLIADKGKLKGKLFGFNEGLVYPDNGTGIDVDGMIARLSAGKGRKKLSKNFAVDYTRGKGKKVDYPILQIANTDDFLTIPGFQTVLEKAAILGGKDHTIAWVNGGSHCNFSQEEIEGGMNAYLAWLDGGPQPTPADVQAACLALPGGIDGDTCDYNVAFVGPELVDRVPARPDWFPAASPLP